MTNQKEDLKTEMTEQAMLILNSVAFLEKQIYNKLAQLDEAINNNYLQDADILDKEVKSLLKKINDENKNMEIFMSKYKKEIKNEEKTILSSIKQKK
jgi:hypothetical protein